MSIYASEPHDPVYLRRVAATLKADGHAALAAVYDGAAMSHGALEEELLQLGRQTMWDGKRFGEIPNGDRQRLARSAKETVDWLIAHGWSPPPTLIAPEGKAVD